MAMGSRNGSRNGFWWFQACSVTDLSQVAACTCGKMEWLNTFYVVVQCHMLTIYYLAYIFVGTGIKWLCEWQ